MVKKKKKNTATWIKAPILGGSRGQLVYLWRTKLVWLLYQHYVGAKDGDQSCVNMTNMEVDTEPIMLKTYTLKYMSGCSELRVGVNCARLGFLSPT